MFERNPRLLLRALSALLAYPDAELRAALPEIREEIDATRMLKRQEREDLLALADEIASGDELEAEGRYVDLFDRGRSTSLNLFQHVHGDGQMRGPAMVELQKRYLEAGLEPMSDELPDHLPLMLEYLSCRDLDETRATIASIAHIVRHLGNTLRKRDSRYAAVMEAILQIGREKGLDATAPVPPPDDFESTWDEKPAFAPPDPEPGVMSNDPAEQPISSTHG